MKSNNTEIDLSFLTVSFSYLQTTENILEKMESSGNPHMTLMDHDDKRNIEERYDEITKWSDFKVILPTLFLFYHGIETLFKGLLFLKKPTSNLIIKYKHDLKKLFNETRKNYPEISFMKKLEPYLIYSHETPLILTNFINSNKGLNNVNDLYLALRYPIDNAKEINYDYFKLKYTEQVGASFAGKLKVLIEEIRKETVKIYREKRK